MASNSRTSAKALLIDLDGVLRLWPRTDADLEVAHGCPAGSLRRVAFDPLLIAEAITGRISDEEWRGIVQERLYREFPTAAVAQAVAAWSSPSGAVNVPVLNLVQKARQEAKVVLVTNATSRLENDLVQLGLTGQFDAIVNSSELGSAKPDREIYLAALETANVTAAEALFIDDQRVNVEAATALGIRAHHFTGSEKLARLLAGMGLVHVANTR